MHVKISSYIVKRRDFSGMTKRKTTRIKRVVMRCKNYYASNPRACAIQRSLAFPGLARRYFIIWGLGNDMTVLNVLSINAFWASAAPWIMFTGSWIAPTPARTDCMNHSCSNQLGDCFLGTIASIWPIGWLWCPLPVWFSQNINSIVRNKHTKYTIRLSLSLSLSRQFL